MSSNIPVTILVIADSGCEEAAAFDVKRWLPKAKTQTHKNIVTTDGSIADACVLGYQLQTARRVLIQIIPPLRDITELSEHKPAHLDQLFSEDLTFKAEGDVLSLNTDGTLRSEALSAQELIEETGEWMHNCGRKVNLSRPDIIVYTVKTSEKIWVGIDVIGRQLAKREWRIMLSRRSLKATIAAAVVLYSGATEKDTILDPLADDGTIVIEAALLLSRTSPLLHARGFAFEKFPALASTDWKEWKTAQGKQQREIEKIRAHGGSLQEVKAIRTNGKLAGVDKHIHATKVTMEWVETKIDENTVTLIITSPIGSGSAVTPRQAEKLNDELFYQAEFVLKKGKTITCIAEKPDELLAPAAKYGFTILEQRNVLMGKRKMTIITFKNNKRKESTSST